MPQKSKIVSQLADLLYNVPGRNKVEGDYFTNDIASVTPDIFADAKNASLAIRPLLESLGAYDPATNEILVNTPGMFRVFESIYSSPRKVGYPTIPHEIGHAITRKDLDRIKQDRIAATPLNWIYQKEKFDAPRYDPKEGWAQIFETEIKNNSALGEYQFKDDPSHGFADAWSAYTTSPVLLQRLMPRVYNFMRDLSGFEYKRERK